MSAPETPVEVVALALDRYAELDEFEPLEDYVLKALGEAGFTVARMEQVGWCTPSMADGPNIGSLLDGKFADDDEPVYRIAEVAS